MCIGMTHIQWNIAPTSRQRPNVQIFIRSNSSEGINSKQILVAKDDRCPVRRLNFEALKRNIITGKYCSSGRLNWSSKATCAKKIFSFIVSPYTETQMGNVIVYQVFFFYQDLEEIIYWEVRKRKWSWLLFFLVLSLVDGPVQDSCGK